MTGWNWVREDAFWQLAGAVIAGAGWYLFPQGGVWLLPVGLIGYGVRWWKTGRLRTATGMDYLLLFFLATALGGGAAAYDSPAAWAKFWLIVGAVLLFEAFRLIEIRHFAPYLLMLLGVGVTVYFLVTHNWEQYPAKVGVLTELGMGVQAVLPAVPPSFHRLHPNVVGGLLAFALPFAGASWISTSGMLPKILTGLATLLIFFGLMLSSSRGAWIAAVIALGAAGGWWGVRQLHVSPIKRRWVWLGMVGSAGTILLLLFWFNSINLLDIFFQPERLNLYLQSWTLASDYPFLGGGLNSFMMLHASYSLLTHVGFAVHAHQLFLDILIEQGGLGLLGFVTMGVMAIASLWREARTGRVTSLTGAAAFAWATIWVHGFTDDPFYGSRAVVLLFLPLALLNVPASWTFRPVAFFWGGIGLLTLLLAPRMTAAAVFANWGAIQQSQAELSLYEWPRYPIQDAVRREIDLSGAVGAYEQALQWNGLNFTANRRLGQIALSLGAYEKALIYLQRAYQTRPADGTTRQLLGEAYLVNGQVAEGQAFLAKIENKQNQLQIRAEWYKTVGELEWAEQFIGVTP